MTKAESCIPAAAASTARPDGHCKFYLRNLGDSEAKILKILKTNCWKNYILVLVMILPSSRHIHDLMKWGKDDHSKSSMCVCVSLSLSLPLSVSQLDLPVCTADSHQCFFYNKKIVFFNDFFGSFCWQFFFFFFPTLNLSNVLIYRNNLPNFSYQKLGKNKTKNNNKNNLLLSSVPFSLKFCGFLYHQILV